jgi:hypothetical protein
VRRILVAVMSLGLAPGIGIVASSPVTAVVRHCTSTSKTGVGGNDTVIGGSGFDHSKRTRGHFHVSAEDLGPCIP